MSPAYVYESCHRFLRPYSNDQIHFAWDNNYAVLFVFNWWLVEHEGRISVKEWQVCQKIRIKGCFRDYFKQIFCIL